MKKAAAAEDLSAKKELALQVIDRLKTEYPDAACTLDYDHAWQLLVSVRLAAQCTDARADLEHAVLLVCARALGDLIGDGGIDQKILPHGLGKMKTVAL